MNETLTQLERSQQLDLDQKMDQTIMALPIKDKEDLLDLIDYRDEGGRVINYGDDKEKEDKWRPIHEHIQENRWYYRTYFIKEILNHQIQYMNDYHIRKTVEYIDSLLRRKKNEDIKIPETQDKEQIKRYQYLTRLRNNKETLEEIKGSLKRVLEGNDIDKEMKDSKVEQKSMVKKLKDLLWNDKN